MVWIVIACSLSVTCWMYEELSFSVGGSVCIAAYRDIPTIGIVLRDAM